MANLKPTVCNLCGGKVELVSNAVIYGREYGSRTCYMCEKCKAYVGTHKTRPDKALGILANDEMRAWRMKCHTLFDPVWNYGGVQSKHHKRKKAYAWLAGKLGVDVADCHFAYFDLRTLKTAYKLLESELSELKDEIREEEDEPSGNQR